MSMTAKALCLLDGVGDGVDEGQAAFGIGVDDLHRFARHGAQHIARQVGIARDAVFAGSYHGGEHRP